MKLTEWIAESDTVTGFFLPAMCAIGALAGHLIPIHVLNVLFIPLIIIGVVVVIRTLRGTPTDGANLGMAVFLFIGFFLLILPMYVFFYIRTHPSMWDFLIGWGF